jgi:DNA-binding NarL/FixJ family response regulator/signal transduction histidine kinase
MRLPALPSAVFVPVAVLGGAGLVASAVHGVPVPGGFGIPQPLVWALAGLLPIYATGVWLFAGRPAHPIARLLLVSGSAMAVATGLGALLPRLLAAGVAPAWLAALALPAYLASLAGPAAMGAMFALFPNGTCGRGYERWVLRGYLALVLVVPPLLLLTHPTLPAPAYSALPPGTVANPAHLPVLAAAAPVTAALFGMGGLMGIAGAVLLGLRYRRLDATARRQTAWLRLAALLVALDVAGIQLLGALGVLPVTVQVVAFYAVWIPVLVLVPAAVLVALFRYRLFDVEVVIRRSVVYGALSMLIGVGYLGLAAALGLTAGTRLPLAASVAVTIAAVVGFAPARRRLQGLADRWAYGHRLGGYELLARFGQTLEHAYDLDELAPELARIVVDGLGLRWVRISLCLPGPVREPVGAVGIGMTEPAEPALVVPMTDQGTEVGLIECGPSVRGEISVDDRQVLASLARQATLAVRNARLSAELAGRLAEIQVQAAQLAASRNRIVAAQDVARRRIERNIHDGVQQQLVALMTTLRLARNRLGRDPATAGDVLAEAQEEARRTLDELRELAHGIHPPVLSDRGIVAAVEARAARLPVGVVVEADEALRETRYPNEIEAAAYFLVSEGLANALKHAEAGRIEVRPTTTASGCGSRSSTTGWASGRAPHAGRGSSGCATASRRSAGGCTSTPARAPVPGWPPSCRSVSRGSSVPSRDEPARLRVVIAEDNYLVREGTRRLLDDSGEVAVVASVGSAVELLDAADRLRPLAVLTDIRMPPGHHLEGIEAAHAIRAAHPQVGVVVLSQHADEAYAFELLKNGTDGLAYLLKDRVVELDQLLDALRTVIAGGSTIDPKVVEALVARRARVADSPLARLTRRELDVLREMAAGKSNAGIAATLVLSDSAVEKHVSSVFAKLLLAGEPTQDRRVTAVLTFLRANPRGARST